MIKDMDYYRSFDLLSAGKKIRELGSDRGNHEIFGDAIQSLLIIADEREVSSTEIEEVLGKPDRIKDNDGGEIWEYEWSDTYGQAKYSSSTPFQITNGVCAGLAPDE